MSGASSSWSRCLLIVDDFGLKSLRPSEDEYFHDLITERYERAAMLLTPNLVGEWGEVFAANKMIGAAILDRLRHGAYRVVLDGESYCSLQPLPETPEMTVAKRGKISHS